MLTTEQQLGPPGQIHQFISWACSILWNIPLAQVESAVLALFPQCLVPLVTGRAGESGKSWFRISTAQQQLNHYFLFKAEYCNSYKENYPRWNQDKGRHFWWRVWWSAKRLAREVTDIPSLETIKIRLDGAVGRLNMMTFNCPS